MSKKLLVFVLAFVMVFSTFGALAYGEQAPTQNQANVDGAKFFKSDSQQVFNAITILKNKYTKSQRPDVLKGNRVFSAINENPMINLIILSDGTDLTMQLSQIGTVKKLSGNIYTLSISKYNLDGLYKVKGIKGLSENRIYKVDPNEKNPIDYKNFPFKPNLETTIDDTNANTFNAMGYDGKGVTVAIIDTGVDPFHEMLQNADGEIKIIDWQDFTGEGDVQLPLQTTVESVYKDVYNNFVPVTSVSESVYQVVYDVVYKAVYIGSTGTYIQMPDILSDGTEVYIGELHENILPNEIYFGYTPGPNTGFDFNLDGDKTDNYFVAGIDSNKDGVLDEVLVDTNLNDNMSDETRLIPYKDSVQKGTPSIASFPSDPIVPSYYPPAKVNFVLTNTYKSVSSGKYVVNLGFDGGSHGTHVAGISTGSGNLKGIAPGAKVMVLKALGSNVGGATGGIMAAMEYAAENGADVVNMSLGSSPDINDGTSPESQLADQLSKMYNIVFSISAGNEGPGINTIGAPGDSTEAITSGAYISHETWAEYGYNVPGEGLWYFSSVGPREDGGIKPTIVTPGSAISSVPEWDVWTRGQYRGPYDLYQGTSMAAPQTTGLSALLLSAARKDGLISQNERLNPELVSEALVKTARHIDGYSPVEEGGGLPNVVAAYNYIKAHLNATKDDISIATDYVEKITNTTGIYVRNGNIPDTVTVYIKNNGQNEISLNLNNSADWISLNNSTLNIPAGGIMPVSVSIDKSRLQHGLNSTEITLDDSSTTLVDGAIPVTIIVPNVPDKDSLYKSEVTGTVAISHYTRHFFRIPDGAQKFTVDLTSLASADGSIGRIRPIIYDPNGIEYNPSEIKYTEPKASTATRVVDYPQAGVWEVDVYSSPASPAWQTDYKLDLSISGMISSPDTWQQTAMSGMNIQKQFNITNLTGADQNIKLVGTGLVDLNTPPTVTHPVIDVNSQETIDFFGHGYIEEFNVTKDNPNFVFDVSISDNNPDDDLDLYLLKVNNDGTVGIYAMSADGDSNESISIKALPEGKYYLDVNAFAVPSGTATVNLSKKILNASDAVNGTQITVSGDNFIQANATGTINASVTAPNIASDYSGLIIVNDSNDNMLTRINTNISVGTVVDKLDVQPATVEITKGNSKQLAVTATYSDGTVKDLTNDAQYTSKDTTIATVDKGLVKGIKAGDTSIDVTFAGVTSTVNVKVTEPAPPPSSGGSTTTPANNNEDKNKDEVKVPVDGGKVEASDKNVTMNFEPGTFNSEVTVKVTPIEKKYINANDTNIKYIGTAYEIDTKGVQPVKPVKAVFKYNDADLNGVNEKLLSVYYYNEVKGTWEVVGGVVDTVNNTVTVNLTHFSKYALMARVVSFSDTSNSWAKENIQILASRNIISGYQDGTFKPDGNITRAEFISMLTRALGIKENKPNVPTFDDVKPTDWYYGTIEAAKQVKLASGYGKEFKPNANITRQEMMAMIINALRANKAEKFMPKGDVSVLEKFKDSSKVQDWAKDSMSIGIANGLIKGVDDNNLAPEGTATRAMAAAMIYRMLTQLGRI